MTFTLSNAIGRIAVLTAAVLAVAAPLALAQQQQANAPQEDPADRYARLIEEAEAYANHAAHMQTLLASQQEELLEIEQQMASLDVTSAAIPGLIDRMFTELEAFVEADLPFHLEQRRESIARLRDEILPQLDTPIFEKFRRVIEIYTIELEYGRTMEAYEDTVDGETADIVRVGRVALLYRKPNGEVGYWDRDQRAWVASPQYTRGIEAALSIAKEESAPDLIVIPVPVPSGGRS